MNKGHVPTLFHPRVICCKYHPTFTSSVVINTTSSRSLSSTTSSGRSVPPPAKQPCNQSSCSTLGCEKKQNNQYCSYHSNCIKPVMHVHQLQFLNTQLNDSLHYILATFPIYRRFGVREMPIYIANDKELAFFCTLPVPKRDGVISQTNCINR